MTSNLPPGLQEHIDTVALPKARRAAERAERRRQRRILTIICVTALLILGALTLFQRSKNQQLSSAIDQKVDASSAAAAASQSAAVQRSIAAKGGQLASALKDICAKGGPDARAIKPLCPQASSVAAQAPVLRLPSQAQVNAGIAAYFIAHPPGTVTPSIDYDKVAEFVTAYLVAHPAPSGPPGKNGADVGPTDQQVKDAVATYLEANPPAAGPSGPPGATGAPGPSGPSGAAGEPPFAWEFTWHDELGFEHSETCQRTRPFNSDQPTYTCQETK